MEVGVERAAAALKLLKTILERHGLVVGSSNEMDVSVSVSFAYVNSSDECTDHYNKRLKDV